MNIYSLFGHVAHAVEFDPTGELAGTTGLSTQDVTVTTINIIEVVLGLVALAFVVLIVIGGFLWMTSGGAEEKIKKAKKLLFSAVIGLVIILASLGITEYIFRVLRSATGTPTATESNMIQDYQTPESESNEGADENLNQ